MKLNYCMDITDESSSFTNTPGIASQRLPFFVSGCGHFFANSEYFTEREGLDNYLLIYTLSGCGTLNYKGVEYTIRPNQAVVFYCYEYQIYRTASEQPWEFKWVHCNGAAMKEYYEMINGESLDIITMGDNTQIDGMLDGIFRAILGKEMLLDVKICTAIMNILSDIITCKHSALNNSKFQQHKEELESVLCFIHSNFARKISTDDLTELVHISKYHFIRLFKAYTGVSPYEYLINYRVNASKTLLKETCLNVNEISLQVGFADTNNFIKYFKRLVGSTPLQYRKYWIA